MDEEEVLVNAYDRTISTVPSQLFLCKKMSLHGLQKRKPAP